MDLKWLFSLLFALAFCSGISHAANRCAELLTHNNFSPEFTGSAIEARIDHFKAEPLDRAIFDLIDYESQINEEFRRITVDVLAAKRAYYQDFTLVDRMNPLNAERRSTDVLVDRVNRHLEELAYYRRYMIDLVEKMAKGSTDYRLFDWRRNYPRTQAANYRPSGLEELRAMELALEKHRQSSVADPENITEAGPGNPPSAISPMNTSHEAIQTDFAADNSGSFSNPW